MKKFTNLDANHPHSGVNSHEASHHSELYDEDLTIQICEDKSCAQSLDKALNETATHNNNVMHQRRSIIQRRPTIQVDDCSESSFSILSAD